MAASASEVRLAIDRNSFPSATPGEDIVRVARLKRVPLVLIGVLRSAILGAIRRVGLVTGEGPLAAAGEAD